MKLSIEAICENLLEVAPVVELHRGHNPVLVGRALLFTSCSDLVESDVLYLVSDSMQLSACFSAFNAYLFIGDSCQIPDGITYIHLDGATLGDVFNCVQNLLAKLNDWESRCLELLLRHRECAHIMHVTMPLLGNPVYLHDDNFNIVAYAEGGQTWDQPYDYVNTGSIPTSGILDLRKNPDWEATFKTTEPTFWKMSDEYPDVCSYLYINVFRDNRFIGRIFVDERNRAIRRIDHDILRRLSEFVKQAMLPQHVQQSSDELLEGCIGRLLDGERIKTTELREIARRMKWGAGERFVMFQIPLDDAGIGGSIQRSFYEALKGHIANCAIVFRDFSAVGLVSLQPGDSASEILHGSMQRTLVEQRLRAGVSRIFDNILDVRDYYAQARLALEIGLKKDLDECLYFFQDLTLEVAAKVLSSQIPPEQIYPEGLCSLIEYDEEHESNFVETLRCYLENNCSTSSTSKALFIHKNTLLYRLNKIRGLSDIDFNDSENRLLYELSLYLRSQTQDNFQGSAT